MRKTKKQYGRGAAFSMVATDTVYAKEKAQKLVDDWVALNDVDKALDITNLNISTLPPIPDTVRNLVCYNNKLTRLPTLPNGLLSISCSKNNLTSLPTLPNGLETLTCDKNNLTSLPALPNGLLIISCNNNNLTSLPTLPNGLLVISCSKNNLTSLPPLPNSLGILNCPENNLTSLPSLPNGLGSIYCNKNNLTSLPTLPNSLETLSCDNNELTSLPSLPNGLIELYCDNNNLSNEYYRDSENPDENPDHDHSVYINRIRRLTNSERQLVVGNNNNTAENRTLLKKIDDIEVPTFKPTDAKRTKVSEPVDVFDAIEYSDIPLTIKEISDDKENIYFKIKNSFFRIDRKYLIDSIKKYDNIIYKCKKSMSGAPRINDINEDKPYFLLRTSAIYAVPLEYLKAALKSNDWVYDLKEDNNMKFTSSFSSVIADYGINYAGRNVNIVSADHCQDGSSRQAYSIHIIELAPKESNMPTKRQKVGGTRVTRRNRTKKLRF